MKPYLRFIGDVHGMFDRYIPLADAAERSIQVGDLGMRYGDVARALDSAKHKVVGGNHDNYELWEGIFINQTPHFLGDYGVYTIPDFGDIFYVRGGRSIDKDDRVMGQTWWPEEELSYSDGWKAIELYEKIKPKFVVTHECPSRIIPFVSGGKTWNGSLIQPSRTANLLDTLFDSHQPEVWLFGHHHRSWKMEHRGTKFQCLDIMECLDFDKKAVDG